MPSPTVIYDAAAIDFDKRGKHHYQIAFHLDSTWGYSLVPLTVISGCQRTTGQQPPGVAAFGGTHGNEWEGQVAVKRLCHDLDPETMAGRVLLMPQLSESACTANRRMSPLDGVNMNRAFPGHERGTISYRIAHFVKTRIFPQVNVVLDIHSGGNEGGFPICTSFHPIPDARQRAEIARVAQLFDTPFIMIYSSNMASGLLTDEAEAEGKITIGGEFGFGEAVNRKGTRHAYEGIKNVLRHYGILPGDIVRIDPERPAAPRFMNAANLDDYIPAPCAGIWEPAVDLGADIEEGQILGYLHDFADHSSTPLEMRAHRSGVLLMMHFPARTEKGVTLYVIAREVEHP
ncbi:MAG TPA: succinylglutamate desuccinylase/aspartoacylase family protein [Bryobacteraceae bacterium]|nr:succinylglutamate desuccinylase/aspartoacylase family protein [Bryobacteraceae bacterium]